MSWSGAKLVDPDRVGIGTECECVCVFLLKVLCLRVSNVEQVMS